MGNPAVAASPPPKPAASAVASIGTLLWRPSTQKPQLSLAVLRRNPAVADRRRQPSASEAAHRWPSTARKLCLASLHPPREPPSAAAASTCPNEAGRRRHSATAVPATFGAMAIPAALPRRGGDGAAPRLSLRLGRGAAATARRDSSPRGLLEEWWRRRGAMAVPAALVRYDVDGAARRPSPQLGRGGRAARVMFTQ